MIVRSYLVLIKQHINSVERHIRQHIDSDLCNVYIFPVYIIRSSTSSPLAKAGRMCYNIIRDFIVTDMR